MKMNATGNLGWGKTAVEVLLIISAGAAVLFPEVRSAGLHAGVGMLYVTQVSMITYRGWKDGSLRLRPNEIVQRIRTRGVVKGRWLETLALFLGFVAMVVIAWS